MDGGCRGVVAMSDKMKDFYPSQIGYRCLNERTNIARKLLDAMYPEQTEESKLGRC